MEAQREAERKAVEERRAAEAAAIQRRKAEEARDEARKVANRKAIEAARKAVSGFHKGDAHFSHRGPQGWEGYSHQHCQVIERAMKASNGSGKVALPGIPFEVRWGDEAVSEIIASSAGGDHPGEYSFQNTRVVRSDGDHYVQPTPWQQESAPARPRRRRGRRGSRRRRHRHRRRHRRRRGRRLLVIGSGRAARTCGCPWTTSLVERSTPPPPAARSCCRICRAGPAASTSPR